ncbi:type II and III secretion system protein family protein [Stappia sp. F7233]|uniref:Type II and III secretion system protein family protein n=1 Tax=Stappia albiluteola TaxID=2758565 RepID=A0A839ABA6_9HYPH|nr:type II and III secretion system protein family protein [Stappia albiluteola]MBA5776232.1 type II and III secretion system protein family protein [Stappia albiluteola]
MDCKRLIGTGLAAFALFCGFLVSEPAAASSSYPKTVNVAAGDRVAGRLLRVGLGRSVVINLGEEVTDVLVSNPEVADAVVRDTRRVFVLGNKTGQASLFLFGVGGAQVASFDLLVEQDTSDLNAILRRIVPDSNITAEAINGSIVLSGTAATPADAQRAADVAVRFSKNEDKEKAVLNTIAVAGKEQVYLKVTVAEVERSTIKQLGVNLAGTIGFGNYLVDFNNSPPFTVNSNVVGQSSLLGGFSAGATTIGAEIEALQRDGVIRTLAEPTLTAISGENASFLAGGEFPIPVAQDNNTLTVEFKKFGVGLDFTPIVQSGGNISLHVKTEVSEITQEGAVDLRDISIPGLKVRRAESTVEMPSGGTLVLAGLLRESYKQDLNGVPGLMQVPILGALFKSRDFLRQQTELVVFVTPYLARPVARTKLARPEDNFAPATDGSTIFLNRLNKIYRVSGEPATGSYHGQIGFIYE